MSKAMRVEIISDSNAGKLQEKVNAFLSTEHLDVYNFIDNVIGDELCLTLLYRITPPKTDAELEAIVNEKLEIEAQKVQSAEAE